MDSFEFGLLAAISLAFLFTWYISPDRNHLPSRLQKIVAISWILFRRIVSFCGAIFGLFICYSMWASDEEFTDSKIFTTLILIAISIFLVFIGIFGIAKYSKLVDTLFPDRVSNTYDWGCMWTTFKLPIGLSSNTLHQRCSQSSKMMGVLPVLRSGDHYEAVLYWSAQRKRMEEINTQNFANLTKEIVDFWPDVEVSIEGLSYEDFIPVIYRDVWTPKPFVGRIAAIGDVSHATSPQLGQGCTMALLDAFSLAEALADHTDLNITLKKWWKTRKYQIMYIRYLSRFLTPLFQSEVNMYSSFRDHVMAPIGKIPLFYNLQLRTLASEVLIDSSKVSDDDCKSSF